MENNKLEGFGWFDETVKNTVATFRGMLLHLESSYSAIFKGGVSLFILSLLAISQSYQMITDYDFQIKSEVYTIEEKHGKPISEVICEKEIKDSSDRAKCRLTKYKSGTNNTAMKYSAFIVVVPLFLGSALLFLSVLGFVLKAQRDGKNKLDE
ncbi:hypothetical protein [Vibrio nomapromontoriensis]|uniref:hypothetical protein n=1 Tax=Vibrio nomapromontoriensis TaxID=2910246 RepID=UPI003D13031A